MLTQCATTVYTDVQQCTPSDFTIMDSMPMLVSDKSTNAVPLMSVERFAELVGIPVGVCQAQADRHLWPIVKIGKRRFINVELVRKQALEAEFR